MAKPIGTCENCKFAEKEILPDNTPQFWCHLNPPSVQRGTQNDMHVHSTFPPVKPTSFCWQWVVDPAVAN